MARKKTSPVRSRPKRILVQLPPDMEDLLNEISRLTGVPVAKLIIDCVVQDKARFMKMLEAARAFYQAATEDRPGDPKKKI